METAVSGWILDQRSHASLSVVYEKTNEISSGSCFDSVCSTIICPLGAACAKV